MSYFFIYSKWYDKFKLSKLILYLLIFYSFLIQNIFIYFEKEIKKLIVWLLIENLLIEIPFQDLK